MSNLRENPNLPLLNDNGRFDNERDIVDIKNANSIKYFMWQIFNDKSIYNILPNLIIPMIGTLADFLALGTNPNRGNIHQYISYAGHVPILAIYLPRIGHEYVIDFGNQYYMNHTQGYSSVIYELLRSPLPVERLNYLGIDPDYNGVTMDYFPLGKNSGYRIPSPIRTSYELHNQQYADLNMWNYKYSVKIYHTAVDGIYKIMSGYVKEIYKKVEESKKKKS